MYLGYLKTATENVTLNTNELRTLHNSLVEKLETLNEEERFETVNVLHHVQRVLNLAEFLGVDGEIKLHDSMSALAKHKISEYRASLQLFTTSQENIPVYYLLIFGKVEKLLTK